MLHSVSNSNAVKDLELMLAPLTRIPAVHGIATDLERYLGKDASPLELQIELELDPRNPADDFAQQLLGLVHQLAISGGVALSPVILRLARKITLHAETISAAWAEVHSRHTSEQNYPAPQGCNSVPRCTSIEGCTSKQANASKLAQRVQANQSHPVEV